LLGIAIWLMVSAISTAGLRYASAVIGIKFQKVKKIFFHPGQPEITLKGFIRAIKAGKLDLVFFRLSRNKIDHAGQGI